jgi:TolB-like protein
MAEELMSRLSKLRALQVIVRMEVPGQTHLWSMEYDRAFQDIFVIQRNIATRVAKAVQPVCSGYLQM